jgi:hypothetical protein
VSERRQTQADKILARLLLTPNQWVPMPELVELSRAYAVHSRISDLRKRGHLIGHKNEHVDGLCHSFYRIVLTR